MASQFIGYLGFVDWICDNGDVVGNSDMAFGQNEEAKRLILVAICSDWWCHEDYGWWSYLNKVAFKQITLVVVEVQIVGGFNPGLTIRCWHFETTIFAHFC